MGTEPLGGPGRVEGMASEKAGNWRAGEIPGGETLALHLSPEPTASLGEEEQGSEERGRGGQRPPREGLVNGRGQRSSSGGRPSPGPRLGTFCSIVTGEEVEGRPLASRWGLEPRMLLNILWRAGSPSPEVCGVPPGHVG